MALSYQFTIKVIQGADFGAGDIVNFWEFGSGTSGGGTNPSAQGYIEFFMDTVVLNYGGTYTIDTSTTVFDGDTYDVYTVTWINLSVDPALDGFAGDFISVHIQDDSGTFWSGRFVPVTQEPTLVTCDTCLELNREACAESYTFNFDLEPATTYTVALESRNGNVYTQDVTTNGSGSFTLDAQAPEFPLGFFTHEAGPYTMKVYEDSALESVVTLTYGDAAYTCVQLNFQYITTTTSSLTPSFDYLIHDYEGDTDFFISTDNNDFFITDY